METFRAYVAAHDGKRVNVLDACQELRAEYGEVVEAFEALAREGKATRVHGGALAC